MTLTNAIRDALNGNAVLFLGAGFSKGAENHRGLKLKDGKQLSDYLMRLTGVEESYELDDAATIFIKKKGKKTLLEELKRELTVHSVQRWHEIIAGVPWRRVYTTNYDNVYEYASARKGNVVHSICLSDASGFAEGISCVHINGFIERATEESFDNDFKLTNRSYSVDTFNVSEWSSIFRRDLSLAKAVFFVGYSLYDLDIKRILFSSLRAKDKTFFYVGNQPKVITELELSDFGTVLKESSEEFAKIIQNIAKDHIPEQLSNDELVTVDKYNFEEAKTTHSDEDVFKFYMFGDLKDAFFVSSSDDRSPLIQREIANTVIHHVKNGVVDIVLHSYMGNGKSVLLKAIAYQLCVQSYDVYIVTDDGIVDYSELETICKSQNRCVIFFENYSDKFDPISHASLFRSDNICFIYTSRTFRHEVNYDKLTEIIHNEKIVSIDINKLNSSEISAVVETIDLFGFWGKRSALSKVKKAEIIAKECECELSNILLLIFKSPQIKSRIQDVMRCVCSNEEKLKIVVTVFALTFLDYKTTVNVICDIVGGKKVLEHDFRRDPMVSQILNIKNEEITFRSSVFSVFIINEFVSAGFLVDVLVNIMSVTDRYRSKTSSYYFIFRELMRYGTVQNLVPRKNRAKSVIRFYESIKNLTRARKDSFFWLQYAIASTSLKKYDRAKLYFDNSYSFAAKMQGFDTYQIDNHYARFLLVSASYFHAETEYMDSFRRAKNIIRRQLMTDKYDYPYKVAQKFRVFFEDFQNKLSNSEKEEIHKACIHVIGRLEKLHEGRETRFDIVRCKSDLNYVIDKIEAQLAM